MVKAELAYNPYLQETKIRFNGRSPRVNSRVEMYLKEKLHDWIEELPEIFRDEMNGYDFDLDFSGTKNDYEDLKKAFEEALEKEKKGAGVSKPEVNIFLRNEIGGREEKLEKIEELMNWLTKSPKRLYDLEEVQKENPDLFGGTYEYIVMHGSEKDENAFENLNVSVENITDLKTLKDTNLCYTPILYVIDDNSLEFLVKDIFDLREKLGDQLPRQLFFRISKTPTCNFLSSKVFVLLTFGEKHHYTCSKSPRNAYLLFSKNVVVSIIIFNTISPTRCR